MSLGEIVGNGNSCSETFFRGKNYEKPRHSSANFGCSLSAHFIFTGACGFMQKVQNHAMPGFYFAYCLYHERYFTFQLPCGAYKSQPVSLLKMQCDDEIYGGKMSAFPFMTVGMYTSMCLFFLTCEMNKT